MADIIDKADYQALIEGTTYSMVKVPEASSALVTTQKDRVLRNLKLDKLITNLMRAGELLFVAYNGVAGHGRLRKSVTDISDKLGRLAGDCEASMHQFQRRAGSILDNLRDCFKFLLQGKEQWAITWLGKASTAATEMANEADALAVRFDSLGNEAVETLGQTMIAQGEAEERREKLKEDMADLEARTAGAKKAAEQLLISKADLQVRYEEAKGKAETAENRAFGLAITNAVMKPLGEGLGAFAGAMTRSQSPMGMMSMMPPAVPGVGGAPAATQPPGAAPPPVSRPPGAAPPPVSPSPGAAPPPVSPRPLGADVPRASPPPGAAPPPVSPSPGAAPPPVSPSPGAAPPPGASRPPGAAPPPVSPPPGAAPPPVSPPPGAAAPPPGASRPPGAAPPPVSPAPGAAAPSGTPPAGTGLDPRATAGTAALGATLADAGARTGQMGSDYFAVAEGYRREKAQYLQNLLDLQREERDTVAKIAEYAERLKTAGESKAITEATVTSLFQAIGALKQISVVLRVSAMFWRQMAAHCKELASSDLKEKVTMFMTEPPEQRLVWFLDPDFKQQVITYLAGWKAIEVIAIDYGVTCGKVRAQIQEDFVKNPNTEESRRLAPVLGAKLLEAANADLSEYATQRQAIEAELEKTKAAA
jgi:hypothetical protein